MKLIRFFNIIALCLLFVGIGYAQEDGTIVHETLFVNQGSTPTIQITAPYGQPTIKDELIEGNQLNLISINNKEFTYEYVPAPEFTGTDGFSLEVIMTIVPPSKVTHVFPIEVISSVLNSENDFIRLMDNDVVTINPLENDEASADEVILSISHVMHGIAEVDSEEIIYTPNPDFDIDYIVYNVKDEFGSTDMGTIYITRETNPDENTSDVANIASGLSEYIFLPSADYSISTDEMEYGTIDQINEYTFMYTANTQVEGVDEIIFTNGDIEHAVTVNVYEKYIDGGNIKDDVFYSAMNTQITFDVSSNDLADQYVITDYSDELYYLGNNVFAYTPPAYFTGVKNFWYTTDDGFNEETGTIELVFNNFAPTNTFNYELSVPKNNDRTIEYHIPLTSEYFQIVSMPDHGTVNVYTEDDTVELGCEEELQKVFAVYTPNANYVGSDEFIIKYCASDNNTCDNVSISIEVIDTDIEDCICVDDCVWPGDANADGKVSVLDALAIGRVMGNGGATRDESVYNDIYAGANSEDWNVSLPNGVNAKHCDANGDGIITIEDFEIVISNYGDVNSVISTDILGVKNLPFYFIPVDTDIDSGELMIFEIALGNENYPAVDLNGISFAINLAPGFVDSSTVHLTYLDGEFFTKGGPFVDLTHQPTDGIIHTAGVKTNGLGSTGFGVFAELSFIVEEDAEGIKNTRALALENGISIPIEVSDIIIEDKRGFKYQLPNVTTEVFLNSNSTNTKEHNISVYPNPASTYVNVAGNDINNIQVFNTRGELVATKKVTSNVSTINTSGMHSGLYLMKVQTSKEIVIKKFYVQ